LVQEWVNGTYDNYGLLLDILSGYTDYKDYKSSDYSSGDYAPYLEISYVPGGGCPEICDNGLDDDGDGLVDCEDPDCYSASISGGTDTDSDDIVDNCDLDDDNDGILDTVEDDCEQIVAGYDAYWPLENSTDDMGKLD